MLVFLIPVLLLLFVWYLLSQRKPKGFPPGPWGFPIFGHLPQLGLEPHKTALRWLPKYGPIVGIDFASFPCVIITGYKLGKEAWNHPAFSGRPKLDVWKQRAGGIAEGVAFSNGRTWREQRTFSHRELKQLGMGHKNMEATILLQVQELIEGLRAEDGTPINTHHRFPLAFFNTLWTLIAGKPFAQNDPTAAVFIKDAVDGLATVNIFTMMSMFMPWFANNFPNWLTRADVVAQTFIRAGALLQPYVDEHWRTHSARSPRDRDRDFIDAFIDEVKKTTDPGSSFHISRAKHSLGTTLLDFFVAGTDTATALFSWMCLLLATYQGVQERVAAEIDAVLGARPPSLHDRPALPFAEAFILHETMRFRTLTPIGGFRSTTEDVHFHGFDIPKDTVVLFNFWEAHNNREFWGDPENFRPERWLKATTNANGNGKEFVKVGDTLAFGSGKRVCIGEQLGRDELFLFLVSIIQNFHIELDPSSPPPTLDPRAGVSIECPQPHKLVFRPKT